MKLVAQIHTLEDFESLPTFDALITQELDDTMVLTTRVNTVLIAGEQQKLGTAVASLASALRFLKESGVAG